jgi:predicted unusual protein kinase regulating ubiquinone biosynthesis (AarF/ABC1/UbiB family)
MPDAGGGGDGSDGGDRDRSLRAELERRLLALDGKLPTSSLGRLGRGALAALRGGRVAWRGSKKRELDIDTLMTLVSSMGQLKGMAMKAGQLMSYLDLQLPPDMQTALAALQTHSPPMPFSRVQEIVERELGAHAAVLLAHMTPEPAAAASIGQVHRARLADGTEVAVKVQYPDIERAIATDFRSAAVGTRFVGLLVPGANVDAVVAQARRAVLDECDYEREARYQERVRLIYAGHPVLAVPAVHRDYCAHHVLTTTWVDGLRFDEFVASAPAQSLRDRMGEAIFEFYVGTLYRHALFNWDPHPGNYIFGCDGRITMLDYGSMRELDREFVRKLATITRAVHTDTRAALHAAFVGLGLVRAEGTYDFDAVRGLVRAFYGPMLRDEVLAVEPGQASPMRTILANKRELLKLHLPGEMLFILRIRFGVMSVLSRLGARANWHRLERQFAASAET